MRQKKRKTTEKETRHQRRHDSLSLSVFRVGFDAQNNWFMLLAVHYRVMEHVGSLESTQEATVTLPSCSPTSRVLHNSIVHAKA